MGSKEELSFNPSKRPREATETTEERLIEKALKPKHRPLKLRPSQQSTLDKLDCHLKLVTNVSRKHNRSAVSAHSRSTTPSSKNKQAGENAKERLRAATPQIQDRTDAIMTTFDHSQHIPNSECLPQQISFQPQKSNINRLFKRMRERKESRDMENRKYLHQVNKIFRTHKR